MAFDERDFFAEPFSEAELRRLAGVSAVSELFSWKSPSFRRLGLDPAGLQDDDLVRMMLEEPRLIRRPLVRVGDALVVGFDRAGLERALHVRSDGR